MVTMAVAKSGSLQRGPRKLAMTYVVGSSAAGLMDVRSNPLGQQMPGVLAHALAVEQMLLGHHLQRPSWATGHRDRIPITAEVS